MQHHRCATCQRSDVRLYRGYGTFLREHDIFCKAHLEEKIAPEHRGRYVPLCEDTDGNVWGYTSVPADAIVRWEALPEAALAATKEPRS